MEKRIVSACLTVVLLLASLPALHSQLLTTEEGVFTRAFVVRTQNGSVLKAKHEAPDGDEVLYFDSKNNIRKYISDFSYPESTFIAAASYDIEGSLIAIIFQISVPEGISSQGYAYKSGGSPEDPLFSYAIFYSEDYGGRQAAFGSDSHFPDDIVELAISDYISVNNLLKAIDLKQATPPSSSTKVRFKRPEKGHYAMLNSEYAGSKIKVISVDASNPKEIRYLVEQNGKQVYIAGSEIEDIEEAVDN